MDTHRRVFRALAEPEHAVQVVRQIAVGDFTQQIRCAPTTR